MNELFCSDDNVVLMKRPLAISLGGGADGAEGCRLQVAVRSVGKRFFASKERIVVCWEGLAEWPRELVEPNGIQSMPMREQGWVMIRRVPGNPGMSILQVCMLAKPGISIESMLKRDHPGQLKSIQDLVIPSYQQLFNSRYQVVENMLFDSKTEPK
uniref:START domain-containing protein n=1 Tax=Globisporangium ultimum (strain ATCC 200006 / CBS 805.95 / DAOM BR144) TaxID=431595 RepID=K3W9F9_GLOUD